MMPLAAASFESPCEARKAEAALLANVRLGTLFRALPIQARTRAGVRHSRARVLDGYLMDRGGRDAPSR